jgi:hypothetical protein
MLWQKEVIGHSRKMKTIDTQPNLATDLNGLIANALLEQLRSTTPPQTDLSPRMLYDRKGAARQLSISVRSLDYLIARKKLATRRNGKKVMIPHGELVRFRAWITPTRSLCDRNQLFDSDKLMTGCKVRMSDRSISIVPSELRDGADVNSGHRQPRTKSVSAIIPNETY